MPMFLYQAIIVFILKHIKVGINQISKPLFCNQHMFSTPTPTKLVRIAPIQSPTVDSMRAKMCLVLLNACVEKAHWELLVMAGCLEYLAKMSLYEIARSKTRALELALAAQCIHPKWVALPWTTPCFQHYSQTWPLAMNTRLQLCISRIFVKQNRAAILCSKEALRTLVVLFRWTWTLGFFDSHPSIKDKFEFNGIFESLNVPLQYRFPGLVALFYNPSEGIPKSLKFDETLFYGQNPVVNGFPSAKLSSWREAADQPPTCRAEFWTSSCRNFTLADPLTSIVDCSVSNVFATLYEKIFSDNKPSVVSLNYTMSVVGIPKAPSKPVHVLKPLCGCEDEPYVFPIDTIAMKFSRSSTLVLSETISTSLLTTLSLVVSTAATILACRGFLETTINAVYSKFEKLKVIKTATIRWICVESSEFTLERVNGLDAQPVNLTNQQFAQLPVISLKQKTLVCQPRRHLMRLTHLYRYDWSAWWVWCVMCDGRVRVRVCVRQSFFCTPKPGFCWVRCWVHI